jgi:hypothetical protein
MWWDGMAGNVFYMAKRRMRLCGVCLRERFCGYCVAEVRYWALEMYRESGLLDHAPSPCGP